MSWVKTLILPLFSLYNANVFIKVKIMPYLFYHSTRLTILKWLVFMWVDSDSGVLGLSTVLKGLTTLPEHGLVSINN